MRTVMQTETQRTLQEQLLLLSLNDETGSFEGPYGSYGLNGAALAELLLRNRIALQEGTVTLKDATPTGDAALDTALERIQNSRRLQSLGWWLRCLYPDVLTLQETLVARLTRQGILWSEEIPMQWGLNLRLYPTIDPAPESELRARLRAAIMGEEPVDARIAALLAILQGCHALSLILTREERLAHKAWIQQIVARYPIARAMEEALSLVMAQDYTDLYNHAVVYA